MGRTDLICAVPAHMKVRPHIKVKTVALPSLVNNLFIAHKLSSWCLCHEAWVWNGKGTGASSAVQSSPNSAVQVYKAKAREK